MSGKTNTKSLDYALYVYREDHLHVPTAEDVYDDAKAELDDLLNQAKKYRNALIAISAGLRGDLPITAWAKEIADKALK